MFRFATLSVFALAATCIYAHAQNIDAYCKKHYGNDARAEGTQSSALLQSKGDAYSWRCVTGVNMEGLCHEQFGKDYHAKLISETDANSWTCVAALRYTELDFRKPSINETEIIRNTLGSGTVTGADGAFAPELLVASTILNGSGREDLVVVQRALCSNHTCTYDFIESSSSGWSKVFSTDSYETPYVAQHVGIVRPDIIIFDHLTNDCEACSPPQPVKYKWRVDISSYVNTGFAVDFKSE